MVIISHNLSSCYMLSSLHSKRLSNIGRAVLGNVGGARSTREGKARKRLPGNPPNSIFFCPLRTKNIPLAEKATGE